MPLLFFCTYSLCAEAEEHAHVVVVAVDPACSFLNGFGISVLLENPMNEPSRKVMQLNRLIGDLSAERCEWIPHWQSDRVPCIEPSDFKVSHHRRPDGAEVCIIANSSGGEKSGALEVSRDAQCSDFLTRAALPHAALPHAKGKLPSTLPGYGSQVIQIDSPK